MTRAYKKMVRAFAPATVANVGSAFDVIGCALDSPGDTVEAVFIEDERNAQSLSLSILATGQNTTPQDVTKNTAGVAALALLTDLAGLRTDLTVPPISLRLEKGLPIGSGLGSSSASAVAALLAVNTLLGEPYSRRDLLPFAMEAERIACGSAHADNVAPSLLGGFVLIRSYTPLDVVVLPTPPSAWLALITPDVEVKTEDARKVLKGSLLLSDAVAQWGNVAGLVAGIFTNDIPLMGRSLKDRVIEPARADLIPCFSSVKEVAIAKGAHGFAISGSGPTLFALCDSQRAAQAVSEAMYEVYLLAGITSVPNVSKINPHGAVVLSSE